MFELVFFYLPLVIVSILFYFLTRKKIKLLTFVSLTLLYALLFFVVWVISAFYLYEVEQCYKYMGAEYCSNGFIHELKHSRKDIYSLFLNIVYIVLNSFTFVYIKLRYRK